MFQHLLNELLRELTRLERQRGPSAVWRRGTVTSVGTSPASVRVDCFAGADLSYLASYSPTVGDVVEIVQQGPDLLVLGKQAV